MGLVHIDKSPEWVLVVRNSELFLVQYRKAVFQMNRALQRTKISKNVLNLFIIFRLELV